jgi:putative SOS response-associated peptidase YedK
MCGRYTIIAKAEEIEKRFHVEVPEYYIPRYNAAPTQILPVITNHSPDGLSFFRWGLIPSWAKDTSIGSRMINARSESVHEKPSFKQALRKRRCIVPADGFYEWKKTDAKTKIPHRITLMKETLFSFAGLWEKYIDPDENHIYSFTIITTSANEAIAPLHERMPVMLDQHAEDRWLDDSLDTHQHLELLKPYDPTVIRTYPVSNMVNKPENDNPELIRASVPSSGNGAPGFFD